MEWFDLVHRAGGTEGRDARRRDLHVWVVQGVMQKKTDSVRADVSALSVSQYDDMTYRGDD
jgi:hypothetical protein